MTTREQYKIACRAERMVFKHRMDDRMYHAWIMTLDPRVVRAALLSVPSSAREWYEWRSLSRQLKFIRRKAGLS